jgi:ComEC/Rec2-related protein
MLSGFSPAVCRAAVMISMVIIGKTFARQINMLNILAVSAFALLLYNPFLITDVGFQLSYLAVAGLVVLQPVVYKWMAFKNKVADKLWIACSVSIAAQVITFPLSALYFHQFPVYFLLSNLFIIIPTAVIMYSGVAYLLLSWVPFLSTALSFILENSILLLNKALAIIEHAPVASIGKIWLTIPEYLLLYAIVIGLFYFLYDKKRWLIWGFLKKEGALIQFYDKRIVIFDKQLPNLLLRQKLKTNYVYITGNPHTPLSKINTYYDYQTLVIDGSNSSQTISKLQGEAKTLGINYHLLKRNISLIAVSNQQQH